MTSRCSRTIGLTITHTLRSPSSGSCSRSIRPSSVSAARAPATFPSGRPSAAAISNGRATPPLIASSADTHAAGSVIEVPSAGTSAPARNIGLAGSSSHCRTQWSNSVSDRGPAPPDRPLYSGVPPTSACSRNASSGLAATPQYSAASRNPNDRIAQL